MHVFGVVDCVELHESAVCVEWLCLLAGWQLLRSAASLLDNEFWTTIQFSQEGHRTPEQHNLTLCSVNTSM